MSVMVLLLLAAAEVLVDCGGNPLAEHLGERHDDVDGRGRLARTIGREC
jgi:hypothetical protein